MLRRCARQLCTQPPSQHAQGSWLRSRLAGARTTASGVVSAFRQLGFETLTVGKLLWRGGARTRGQYKLIERNSKDLAQLVPFTIVAAMPAGFFILPILVKIFPGFVPSVFAGKNYKSEKVLILTQVRRKLTPNIRKSLLAVPELHDTSAQVFDSAAEVSIDFQAVAEQLRGRITWDALGGEGLRATSEFFGSAAWTARGRRRKLERLQSYLERDDRLIMREGLDTLSLEELVEENSQRGLRVINMAPAELRAQLREWHGVVEATSASTDLPLRACIAMLMFYRNLKLSDRKYEEPG